MAIHQAAVVEAGWGNVRIQKQKEARRQKRAVDTLEKAGQRIPSKHNLDSKRSWDNVRFLYGRSATSGLESS